MVSEETGSDMTDLEDEIKCGVKKIFVPRQCVCMQLFGQVKWRLNVVHQQMNNVQTPELRSISQRPKSCLMSVFPLCSASL